MSTNVQVIKYNSGITLQKIITGEVFNTDTVLQVESAELTGDLNVANDIACKNLTVSGTLTEVETLTIADNIIMLSKNQSTPILDSGIEVERGNATNATLLWNETTDTWQCGLTNSKYDIITSNSLTATGTLTPSSTDT